jgi:uncharacterized membrane protein
VRRNVLHPERPAGATRIRATAITLALVLGATVFTLTAGLALKAPCASGNWKDGRQYRQYCYSDVVSLYRSEQLSGNRLPYLNACEGIVPCDEYPPVTMYYLRAAAWVSGSSTSFFWVNVLALSALALVTSWALFRMAGERALYFAMAPTLLLYGFMNTDLIAVALTTVATLLFFRRRDGWSGSLLGLGIAAKIYPAAILMAFGLQRLRERRRGSAALLLGTAAAAWAVTNLPFMVSAFHSWSTFFRFNGARTADWDSVWFIGCTRYIGAFDYCPWAPKIISEFTVVGLVAVVGTAWRVRQRRTPEFARWELGFLFLAGALLASKVYSPQYSLWLLPWFALIGVSPWLFAAFEAAEVAVFLTRFSWFGRLFHDIGRPGFANYHGFPIGTFEGTVLVRDAVLLLIIWKWATRGERSADRLPSNPLLERLRPTVGQRT